MLSKTLTAIDANFCALKLTNKALYQAKTTNPPETKHVNETALGTKEKLDCSTIARWGKMSLNQLVTSLITAAVLSHSKCVEKSSHA